MSRRVGDGLERLLQPVHQAAVLGSGDVQVRRFIIQATLALGDKIVASSAMASAVEGIPMAMPSLSMA